MQTDLHNKINRLTRNTLHYFRVILLMFRENWLFLKHTNRKSDFSAWLFQVMSLISIHIIVNKKAKYSFPETESIYELKFCYHTYFDSSLFFQKITERLTINFIIHSSITCKEFFKTNIIYFLVIFFLKINGNISVLHTKRIYITI